MRRIVAGRDRQAAGQAQAPDVVRDRGRRDRPVRQQDVDTRPGEDFRRRPGELGRGEPRVVADHDLPDVAIGHPRVDAGRRRGHAPHGLEGAAVGDDSSPAVRPERKPGDHQRGKAPRMGLLSP